MSNVHLKREKEKGEKKKKGKRGEKRGGSGLAFGSQQKERETNHQERYFADPIEYSSSP